MFKLTSKKIRIFTQINKLSFIDLHIYFQSMNSSAAEEQKILNLVATVINSVSVCGCLFNIMITILLKKLKNNFSRMVLVLAIFDFLMHITYSFSILGAKSNTFCQFVSWITYFGYASSIIFTSCFAHSLYWSLKRQSVTEMDSLYFIYIFVSVLVGTVVGTVSVMVEYRRFDPTHLLCVAGPPVDNIYWKDIFILVIPGVSSIVLCLFYYIRTIKLLHSLEGGHHIELLVYPLILIVCFLPTMVRKVGTDLEMWNTNSFTFRLISYVLIGSQGFLNSLAYGLSKGVLNAIKDYCCQPRKVKLIETVQNASESDDSDTGRNSIRKCSIQQLRVL